jgi:hypothetical protein
VSAPTNPLARETIRIDVKADRRASIVDAEDRTVCEAPCSVEVDPRRGPFVAEIPNMPDSPPFELPSASSLDVTVVGGAPVLPGLAAVVGTVGGVGMAVGLTVLFADLGASGIWMGSPCRPGS